MFKSIFSFNCTTLCPPKWLYRTDPFYSFAITRTEMLFGCKRIEVWGSILFMIRQNKPFRWGQLINNSFPLSINTYALKMFVIKDVLNWNGSKLNTPNSSVFDGEWKNRCFPGKHFDFELFWRVTTFQTFCNWAHKQTEIFSGINNTPGKFLGVHFFDKFLPCFTLADYTTHGFVCSTWSRP